MSKSVTVAVAVATSMLCSSLAIAQSPGTNFTAWLQQRYPSFARANAADALDAARQQGLIQTPAEHLAFKRAFHALREQKRGATSVVPMLLDAPLGPSIVPTTEAVVNEIECNDGPEFATALGSGTSAAGDCSLINDVDMFWFVAAGEYITFEVQAVGTLPISDSTLTIRSNTGQIVAFSEDISATNFLSKTAAYLPPGIYTIEVSPWDSTGGGTYNVALLRDPVTYATLQPGPNLGTTTIAGTGAQTVWNFTLPTDSTVDIGVLSAVSASDLTLAIQHADGRVWFTNDDSNRNGTDPSADLDLPAGSYTVHLADLGGNAIPYTLTYTVTPTVLPDLATAGPQSGYIFGQESRRLYRVNLTAAGQIDMQTAAGPALPIGDTIQNLFDANLNFLCDIDDANPANANDYYSRLTIGLPAGSYYVAVRGYLATYGDYALTPTTGLPFPTTGTVGYGRNPLVVPGSGQVALATLAVQSGNSVRLDSSGGLTATLYGFMDATGHSLGVYEWSEDVARIGPGGRARSRETAAYMPRGTSYVLSWYRFEQSATGMSLDILPPLHTEGGQLVSHGHAGDLAFLFGDLQAGPGVNLGAFGFDGWLALPLPSASLTTIGFRVYNGAGVATWFPAPTTSYGIYLQHVDLFGTPGTFLGAARDRRRL